MLLQDGPRDPHRPIYHFSPPQGVWGGGPDGTIHHAGLYHVFYQYNPYLYTPAGNTHWGHAVSPDLVHWEPRPIALAPSPVPADLYKSLAESAVARTLDRTGMPTILNDRTCCYSGSAVVNDGVPTIVYTRYIHGLPDEPIMRGRAQCIATSDDAMLTWTKRPDPVIAAPPAELVPRALRDQPTRWMVRGRSDDHLKPGHLTAWHDPHVWRGDDGWYLALGSGFMGVGGALLLYRSDDLLDWEYLHPLCAGAEPEFNRWLVPDFFPLDGRHVLLAVATTRGRASKKIYQTGRYRDRRFQTGHEGFTDADTGAPGPFSCARTLTAPDGRRILFGVVNEQRPFHANPFGWASVLSLPRVLAVDGGGSLRMEPAREVCESIRRPRRAAAPGGLAQEIARPVLLSASRCYDTAMMRVAVWGNDLSDTYLRTVTQLGAEAIDMGRGAFFPGVSESGYPDADALAGLVLKLRPFGLRFNRVTLPDITDEFMLGRDGADRELENTCRALRVFADAGIPIARQRFAGDTFNHRLLKYESRHRGGYRSRGESRDLGPPDPDPATHERLEGWWDRFCAVYEKLVPIADEYGIRLAIHPSDTPLPDTPLGTLGFHRVIDAFPSPNVGYLYCCGTRAEAGGPPLVMDEINLYGRKGRIFTVHLRNVRGNLATAGGFEEVLLDDGDMNMSRIVRELSRVGFDGCLNPDHLQPIEGDGRSAHQALAYSIGYIKALLTALAA